MNIVCKLLWSATQFQIAICGNDSIQCIHPSTSWSDLSPSRTSKKLSKDMRTCTTGIHTFNHLVGLSLVAS